MISHLMFDLDGTLIDSEKAIADSSVETIKFFTGEIIDEQIFKEQIGIPIKEILSPFIQENTLDAACDYYRIHLIKHGERFTELLPGTVQILDFAIKNKIKASIVTNKYSETAKAVLKQQGIYFSQIQIFGGDLAASKPSPELLKLAMKGSSKGTYMVGDRPEDIIAAQRAGVQSILIGSKFKNLFEKINLKPDYEFSDLLELLDKIRIGEL